MVARLDAGAARADTQRALELVPELRHDLEGELGVDPGEAGPAHLDQGDRVVMAQILVRSARPAPEPRGPSRGWRGSRGTKPTAHR